MSRIEADPVGYLRSSSFNGAAPGTEDLGNLSVSDSVREQHNTRAASSSSISALYDSVESYVEVCQGKKVIKKVLIANNGIGAVKCIRSVRSWAYENFGDDRAIIFVCMATPEDLRSNAEYIRMADECLEVPGGANNNNYANVQLIVRLAKKSGADAVWAGWGHASENPVLPESLSKVGIAFIGPASLPMKLLGDKIGSTIIAQSAGCPTISWNGDGLTVDTSDLENGIPDELYDQANVKTVEQCVECCQRVGFPVMIKASEGGGGKGIRMVTSMDQVADAYKAVCGEIPGSPIFVMKLSSGARHLEVQLLADEYGQAIALSGRDCSIQRRHQKIIEEGPPLAPTPEIWVEMEKAAVRLAKAVRYANAGTVEYLFKDGKFFFLELNPRLQVEHPVTEMITGINLPAAQLNVAMGIPLHKIPDVRQLYVNQKGGDQECIPFDDLQVQSHGHVIAARITAENPDSGFTPTSGAIQELNFRNSRNVWGYFSLASNGRVHEFADSQIGHIFSWGENREKARKAMVIALKELSIRGEIRTTVDYLVRLMEDSDFRRNLLDTTWLDKRIRADGARSPSATEENNGVSMSSSTIIAIVGAACRAHQIKTDNVCEFCQTLERGQTPSADLISVTTTIELIYNDVKYNFKASQNGADSYVISCNDSWVLVSVRGLSDGGCLVQLGGKSFTVYLKGETGGLRMVVSGQTYLFTKEYDPSQICAAMAGKLVRYMVPDGAHVTANSAFCEVEVMKMFMPLLVPETGTITFTKPEGAVLEPGDIIAKVLLDDPDKVRKASLFDRRLPFLGSPYPEHDTRAKQPHHTFHDALKTVKNVMAGRVVPEALLAKASKDLDDSLSNIQLPYYELMDCLSVLTGRMPGELESSLLAMASDYSDEGGKNNAELPVQEIGDMIEKFVVSLPGREADAVKMQLEPMYEIIENFKHGIAGHRELILTSLVQEYLDVESHFASKLPFAEILMKLRQHFASDRTKVYEAAISHRGVAQKSNLIIKLLDTAKDPRSQFDGLSKEARNKARKASKLLNLLTGLSSLSKNGGGTYAPVTLTARKMLIRYYLPSLKERRLAVQHVLEKSSLTPSTVTPLEETNKRGDSLSSVVESSQPIFQTIVQFWEPNAKDGHFAATAMEAYIRRAYRAYNISSVVAPNDQAFQYIQFEFNMEMDVVSPSGLSKMHKSDSFGSLNLASMAKSAGAGSPPARQGIMCVFQTVEDMKNHFTTVLSLLSDSSSPSGGGKGSQGPPHTLHIVLLDKELGGDFRTELEVLQSENLLISRFEEIIKGHIQSVKQKQIRRITIISQYAPKLASTSTALLGPSQNEPGIYTFRSDRDFGEDSLIRNIEATQAHKLELSRLVNYSIRPAVSPNRAVHVYEASSGGAQRKKMRKRFFVRSIVRNMRGIPTFYYSGSKRVQLDAYPGPEARFVDCLDALEVAMAGADDSGNICGNHIFLNCVQTILIRPEYFEEIIGSVYKRYSDRIRRLRVSNVEFRLSAKIDEFSPKIPVRLLVADPTGFVPMVEMYVESKDAATGNMLLTTLPSRTNVDVRGSLDGQEAGSPHPLFGVLQEKRQLAQKTTATCYCYDFIELFRQALSSQWKKCGAKPPEKTDLVKAVELVLDCENVDRESGQPGIKEVVRPYGQNDIGMVAWILELNTPEFNDRSSRARKIVVIANDITHKVGSFGTREDKLFSAASEYARKNGLPRIYLAANSGARIGMAEEVKQAYKVSWVDDSDPTKGFNYIYLDSDDYNRLASQGSVAAKAITVKNEDGEDEERFIITDIIGSSPDLGVENLRGSGTIAGDTSRAYDETFTLTYVTGRCVGIGAYLVRLGQRTIQKATEAPILLTGYQAINKLLGTPVYSSNLQLGGPGIMYSNGVSHLTVEDDLEGVEAILRWLSYIPSVVGGALPIMQQDNLDSPDRNVEVFPTKAAMDPRLILTGTVAITDSLQDEEQFLAGFFDRNSWTETLGGWAQTVITGRACLGGIPIGVIVPESRSVEYTIPADPASPQSREQHVKQPGGVWFPDSAYKTSQAINDFNREGLPLMIFANWRGFSGGQRDMYDEVLKYGAYIVDALVKYKQPVFVYLPPHATLRGGAWAVLDSTINPNMMEMYSDPKARGGILEAPGAVSIKYRKKQIVEKIHQLDPVLKQCQAQLDDVMLLEEEKEQIKLKIKDRESQVSQTYVQVATHFADLHDTPGRMKAKGCIHGVVEWRRARAFFYYRLRRKLAEYSLRDHISTETGLQAPKISSLLKVWYLRSLNRQASAGRPVSAWRQYASGQSGASASPTQVNTSPADGSADDVKWADDRKILNWMSDSASEIDDEISRLRENKIIDEIVNRSREDRNAALKGILRAVDEMDPRDKLRLKEALN